MITVVVWLFIAAAATVAVHVAGLEFEATEGHNVSILFKTGLERVDEVRISFEGEGKRKLLLARYCFPAAVLTCDPFEAQHLQVEGGNVSLILLKVNISSSGLYIARVMTANVETKVTATLVVNQAPVTFTTAPPHSTNPPPPNSSDLRGLYALVPVFIVIILGFSFWKLRKRSTQRMIMKKPQKLLLSPAPVVSTENKDWKNDCGGCVVVAMDGCGENAEALLVSQRVELSR